jgi:multiple sugar transport system ATP-binding protein
VSPLFVAGFIGSPRMNLLPATVAASSEAGVEVELDTEGPRIALPPRAAAPQRPGSP